MSKALKNNAGKDVFDVLNVGIDFTYIGRSAILHHDFPKKVMADPNFEPTETPVNTNYLHKEGLSDKFVTYMKRWPNFVE